MISQKSVENNLNELEKQKQQKIQKEDRFLKSMKNLDSEESECKFTHGESSDEDDNSDEQNFNFNKKVLKQSLFADFKLSQKCKDSLPPSVPILDDFHSLEPDMYFGWRPTIKFVGPFPLNFRQEWLDTLIDTLLKGNYANAQVVYLGFRPKDSFVLHNLYSSHNKSDTSSYYFSYLHIMKDNLSKALNCLKNSIYYSSNITDCVGDRPFLGMNPKLDKQDLQFDSCFEEGNLDLAIRVNEREYDLFMRIDSNTKGHLQWFYFKIKNAQKGQTYKFNICNFTKQNSLYTRGMKPYIFSEALHKQSQINWQQNGENVQYQTSKIPYERYSPIQKKKQYFEVSFELKIQYENDTISIAYCIPYSYTKLVNFIKEMSSNQSHTSTSTNNDKDKKQKQKILQKSFLCQTLSGVDVPLLTITEHQAQQGQQPQQVSDAIEATNQNDQYFNKKIIIISGRVHPGESNGSYMVEGLIRYLMADTPQAKNLRQSVIMGNYRTGFGGMDLNRQFNKNSNKLIFPTVSAFKALVAKHKEKYGSRVVALIDFHGHSIKRNVFMYGPEFAVSDKKYYMSKFIPKLISAQTEMFRFNSCIFKISHSKRATARAVFFQHFNISNCYTIEASFGSFLQRKDRTSIPFTEDIYCHIGHHVADALLQFYLIMEEYDKSRASQNELKRNSIKSESDKEKRVHLLKMSSTKKKVKKGSNGKSNQKKKNKEQNKPASQGVNLSQNDEFFRYFKNVIDDMEKQLKREPNEIDSDEDIKEGSSDCESSDEDLSQSEKQNFYAEVTNNLKFFSDVASAKPGEFEAIATSHSQASNKIEAKAKVLKQKTKEQEEQMEEQTKQKELLEQQQLQQKEEQDKAIFIQQQKQKDKIVYHPAKKLNITSAVPKFDVQKVLNYQYKGVQAVNDKEMADRQVQSQNSKIRRMSGQKRQKLPYNQLSYVNLVEMHPPNLPPSQSQQNAPNGSHNNVNINNDKAIQQLQAQIAQKQNEINQKFNNQYVPQNSEFMQQSIVKIQQQNQNQNPSQSQSQQQSASMSRMDSLKMPKAAGGAFFCMKRSQLTKEKVSQFMAQKSDKISKFSNCSSTLQQLQQSSIINSRVEMLKKLFVNNGECSPKQQSAPALPQLLQKPQMQQTQPQNITMTSSVNLNQINMQNQNQNIILQKTQIGQQSQSIDRNRDYFSDQVIHYDKQRTMSQNNSKVAKRIINDKPNHVIFHKINTLENL